MNHFNFYNPVRLIFGKNQISQLRTLIEKNKKIMIVYGGGSIKKNGVWEQVTEALKDHKWIEFGGVLPNPEYDHLMNAVGLAKKENVDFLLAIGGGSVIDATKFLAAAIHQKEDPWKLLTRESKVTETTPFGAVLTLPATGSEMNMFSVINRKEEKLGFGHESLYPRFSILDPQTTFSLPEKQVGNGVVDAFVHVCEQYLTQDLNTPIQDRMAEGILKTLIQEGPKAIELKNDYDSRANIMWAATMALNGIIGQGVVHDWATHMIGHELTALYRIDHARSLALILPSLLRLQSKEKETKLLMFAQNVWDIKEGTPAQKIEKALLRTEDFFNSMGLPTKLKVYNISANDFDKIIASVRKHHHYNLGENGDIDEKKIKEILTLAL